MKKIMIVCCFQVVAWTISSAQNGFTFHPYPQNYTLYELRNPNDLFADAQNNIWIAFSTIGLGKFSGGTFTMLDTTNSGIPSNIVYAVVSDNQNNLWVSTYKGLARYDGATWTVYDSINSPLPGLVYRLHMNGNLLWCGTRHGAVAYDGSTWTIYNNQNSGIAGDTITAFASGNNGELWIGTSNMGISEFANSIWTTYNTGNSGLGSNSIGNIKVDLFSNVWIASGQAKLYKKSGNVIYDFLNDLYEGVVSQAVITGYNGNSMMCDNNGFIHFSFSNGLNWNVETISGNNVDMVVAMNPFQTVAGTSFNVLNKADQNNHFWNSTLLEQNGIYGIVSIDISQQVPVPFAFTNANSKLLNINEVEAAILNQGDMHWDLDKSRYSVPKSGGKTSVFTSALWMGGIDSQQQLHTSAQTYRQQGFDYWPGPIDTVSTVSDSATAILYDRIWKIDRNMIEDFKYHFNNGSVTNGTYPVPEEIATWPAHGTGNISRDLAPFVDFNTDAVYNPMNGDFPLIRGDQMLFWIFNDNLSAHTVTDTLPFGFEVHASAYAYTCDQLPDSEQVMQHSTFYHYRIINRSVNDYHDFYIGLWCDNDLGNAFDDYVGCDTVLNAAFVYNGDNDDENAWGYGLNPPMQNVKILDGPLADTGDGADNDHDGTIDELGEKCMMGGFMQYYGLPGSPMGYPASGDQYYSYLKNYWLNGSPLTYGGDGSNQFAPVTRFIYSGTPYDTGWTEFTAGNQPSDRRLLLSSGPFSLPAGGETSIDFAYVFTRDTTGPNGLTTSIARNKRDLQRIQNWYDNQNFPSCLVLNPGIEDQDVSPMEFTLQPNPANDVIYIKSKNIISGNKYGIYDISGRKILSGILNGNSINIDALDNGMYFLEITGNGTTGLQKFIRQ